MSCRPDPQHHGEFGVKLFGFGPSEPQSRLGGSKLSVVENGQRDTEQRGTGVEEVCCLLDPRCGGDVERVIRVRE